MKLAVVCLPLSKFGVIWHKFGGREETQGQEPFLEGGEPAKEEIMAISIHIYTILVFHIPY